MERRNMLVGTVALTLPASVMAVAQVIKTDRKGPLT